MAQLALEDEIYEAAFIPEKWPDVMDRIGRICAAEGAVLFTFGRSEIRWTATPTYTEFSRKFIGEGWMGRNSRATRAAALDHIGFLREVDVYAPHEVATDEMQAFMVSEGWGRCIGTVIQPPGSEVLVFNWERPFPKGAFSDADVAAMDQLRPHLARAGFVAARLQLERAQAATALLETLGFAAGVLSPSLRLLAANSRLEALIPGTLADTRERLRFVDPDTDALVARAFGTLRHGSGDTAPFSVPIRRGRSPAILHIVPVRGFARDVFSNASAIIVLTPVPNGTAMSAELIQGLFDLTPAEARVARGIAEGSKVQELANRFGSSAATIRVQLRAVFEKTGVSRQADLVRLLSATPFGTPDHPNEG